MEQEKILLKCYQLTALHKLSVSLERCFDYKFLRKNLVVWEFVCTFADGLILNSDSYGNKE